MKPVRIGVVGCGGIARGLHLPVIAALPDLLELVAVCDQNGEMARETAAAYGVAAHTRFEDLLADDLEAVSIPTYAYNHHLLGEQAAAAGKHVTMEKPIAITRPCADRVLEACAPGVEMLSHLADYERNDLGPCLSVFENPQGGRVAVAGYYAWTMITTAAKVGQYRALAQWLSRDRLPAVVETLAKVVLWVRAGARGRRAVILLNASLDRQPGLAVQLRMPAGRVEHVPLEGAPGWLDTEAGAQPGTRRAILPEVGPWSLRLLLLEPAKEGSGRG